MIATLVFSLCVTGLCCYTVNMLLKERAQMQTTLYKTMMEIDTIALAKPLNIKKRALRHKISDKHKNQTIDMVMTDVTEKKPIENVYPITPSDKLSIGYGFDVRV
jgi:hypothetical protein